MGKKLPDYPRPSEPAFRPEALKPLWPPAALVGLSGVKTIEFAEPLSAFLNNVFRVQYLSFWPLEIAGVAIALEREGATDPDAFEKRKHEVVQLLEYMGAFAFPAVQAWLSSILVGTWTAFETLAGDLWVKAVNTRPQYLAGLTGAGNRIARRARDKPKPDEKAGKTAGKEVNAPDADTCEPLSKLTLTLGDLCKITRGKYDLGDKMGALLAEAKQVQFTSLANIREAYSLAFPEKVKRARSQRIDSALANNALDALSAVRNLIVHKGGKVDAVYLADCKSAPTAPRLGDKETLRLDGEICCKLAEPVIRLSVELIHAVDAWLVDSTRP